MPTMCLSSAHLASKEIILTHNKNLSFALFNYLIKSKRPYGHYVTLLTCGMYSRWVFPNNISDVMKVAKFCVMANIIILI